MCLGIPYQVVEVEDRDSCLVRLGSGVQRCFTGLVEEVAVGDWLLMHAGFALRRIPPEDAAANLRLLLRAAELDPDAGAEPDASGDAEPASEP